MRYRKKPVTIEAVQWSGDGFILPDSDKEPGWITEARAKKPNEPGSMVQLGAYLHIQTLEGMHRANPGDWIIRGVKNELYPCKPDIFAATYDPVEEPAA